MKIIAVEEHMATEPFLSQAHKLEVVPSDQYEMGLMRQVENNQVFRTALVDLDSRINGMDACGQSMAVLSLNPPGVQPYPVSDAVPLAREFNDSLAESLRRYPDRFGGLGTVTPQDPVAAASEIERIMGPLGLSGIMINSHTGGHYRTNHSFHRSWTLPKHIMRRSICIRERPVCYPHIAATGCQRRSGDTRLRLDCTRCV